MIQLCWTLLFLLRVQHLRRGDAVSARCRVDTLSGLVETLSRQSRFCRTSGQRKPLTLFFLLKYRHILDSRSEVLSPGQWTGDFFFFFCLLGFDVEALMRTRDYTPVGKNRTQQISKLLSSRLKFPCHFPPLPPIVMWWDTVFRCAGNILLVPQDDTNQQVY